MPATIRRGSSGEDVRRWQAIIGATTDGAFGPGTESATKVWQSSHKLVSDGIVGPATWSLALGEPLPKVIAKTPQANTDNEAYRVAKKAEPNFSEREIQYALTVARGEGFYGRGWGNPNAKTVEESRKRGLTGSEGVGSNNWGAVQGTGPAGSFRHVDYHADGSPYDANYKRYSTPEQGFSDMARIILKGGKRGAEGESIIKAAIKKGALRDAVFAQHANGYFELAPEKYLSAVAKNYGILTANNEWPKVLSEDGANILGGILAVGLILVGGIVTIIGFKHIRS